MSLAGSNSVSSRRVTGLVGCAVAIVVLAVAQPGGSALAARHAASTAPTAVDARRESVRETVSARLVNHQGTRVLNERGTGSGTVPCSVSTQLVTSYTKAVVTFTCSTHNGSVTGRGSTSFYASGAFAYFKGPLAIIHGTGIYSHATTRSLTINGSLRRGSYALSATVSGELRY